MFNSTIDTSQNTTDIIIIIVIDTNGTTKIFTLPLVAYQL